MIPNFVSSAPSPFPVDPREDNVQRDHQLFLPNYQTASSSSVSCSVFFNPPQDQPEYYHVGMHQDQPQREDVNHAPYTGSHDPENKPNKGLKISLWKINENDQGDHHHHQENPVKWMSSKMRMMQKMKKYDITTKPEDQKQPTSSLETDHFSSNSSSNNSNPTPIRVCADCNTTKTPLWRSGPKGPKSLCNACGIRQRKARRALAAAATAANGTSPHYETTASLKIKVQNKEKTKNNGHMSTTQFKKRSKVITAGSSHHHAQQKNNVFEDFLFNLSKNSAFHRVFPQDEKEAAILLMALSCGLVHG